YSSHHRCSESDVSTGPGEASGSLGQPDCSEGPLEDTLANIAGQTAMRKRLAPVSSTSQDVLDDTYPGQDLKKIRH
ncbi:unnamed protein product, partial [Protopolystoma xenopodis]